MKKIEKKDLIRFLNSFAGVKPPQESDFATRPVMQLLVWIPILGAMPIATYLSTRDAEATKTSFWVVWDMLKSPLIVYFVNFYILHKLFFQHRYWLFGFVNLTMILALNSQFIRLFIYRNDIPEMPEMTPNMWIGFFSGFLMFLLLNCMVAAIAIGIRHFIRIRQIKQQLMEEKAKNTEAELAWLKNQINPHFLFNTLNNISSLCQIDADAAQDAIAQLSDLLRYAMYETNKPLVPILGEVEFMRNYISLMKLRCNDKTVVNAHFSIPNPQQEIAPLLFISLIENAFKHGVSSSRPSHIDISLQQNTDELVFTCDNTNYPKDDADRSGSGIGLENTRRRLDLMYADHYTWNQSLENDIYHVNIKLRVKN
jgi:hypothetical protein